MMVYPPPFNSILIEVQGFVLEFDDRVEKPSVKNFQMIEEDKRKKYC